MIVRVWYTVYLLLAHALCIKPCLLFRNSYKVHAQHNTIIKIVSSFHHLSHFMLREMGIHFCFKSLNLYAECLFQFGVNVHIVSISTVSLNGWTPNRSTSCVQCVDRTGNSRATQRPWERDNSGNQCVPNPDLCQCVNDVHCVKIGELVPMRGEVE